MDGGALADAVGAYIRAAPAHDLPPPMRKLRSFTPAGLRRRHEEVLSLLDDEAARSLMTEWLDKARPPVGRRYKSVLEPALKAGTQWRELLAADGAEAPQDRGAEPDRGAVQEQEKAQRAKQDARRAKQQAREAVTRERARADAVAAEAADLKRLVSEQESLLASLRNDLERARDQLQGDRRKSERKLQRVEAERDRAKEDAADLRREVRNLRAEVRGLARELERTKAASRPAGKRGRAATAPAGPRVQLPVPKGRLEDEPETLAEWLGTPNVHLLVDGYNVTLAEGGFSALELESQRERLVQSLEVLARRKRFAATVVFDGAEVGPGIRRRRSGPVRVVYSNPDEIADDHLVALLGELPAHPVVVATNDQELQDRARSLGATVATSNQLLALLH